MLCYRPAGNQGEVRCFQIRQLSRTHRFVGGNRFALQKNGYDNDKGLRFIAIVLCMAVSFVAEMQEFRVLVCPEMMIITVVMMRYELMAQRQSESGDHQDQRKGTAIHRPKYKL
jgi:hypothetical protein